MEKYDCYLEEFRTNPQSSNWTNGTGAHAYISFTYDGVWALAFALDNTRKELIENNSNLTLDQFKYFNETPEISEAITRYLGNTSFAGVSVSALSAPCTTYMYILSLLHCSIHVPYVIGSEKRDHLVLKRDFLPFSNCHNSKASRALGFWLGL